MRKADLVFFLSGAAALVYEVVWTRLLTRLVGSDALGIGVVLAVFMAGLGIGALAFSGLARRTRDPRRLFLVLELGLAAWACASPFLLDALAPVASLGARLASAAALLFPPTLVMGATFPLMGRLVIRRSADAGRDTSSFYGANTIGAAAGALAAPFLLMPALGLTRTLFAAAALDVVAGILVLGLAAPAAPASERSRPAPDPSGPRLHPVLLTPFLLGFASLALEVVLTRVLVTMTGASIYAFALVLTVYLGGIGLGSRQAMTLLARPGRAKKILFYCAALLPLLACAGVLLLRLQLGEPDLFGPLSNIIMVTGTAPWRVWAIHAVFAALALAPPAVAFGMALPAAVAVLIEERPAASRELVLGRVYAINTAGATLGSLAGAFLFLPVLGPRLGFAAALALAFLAALPVARRRLARLALLGVAAVVAGWLALRPAEQVGTTVVIHVVGSAATISVVDTDDGRALRVNGKVVASTAPVDLRLQRLLGHVPGVLHGDVRSALVIGLGTGMTAGSLLDLPGLERLEVVEISAAVLEGARHFGAWNGGLLDDPRTEVIVADGRHVLLMEDARYDLITSDPIHPWTRGSSDLYALEHFERMAAHLAPGGIASQWLPLYQLSDEDVRTVVATWCAAFETTAAWLTAYDLALIGWNDAAGPRRAEGWSRRPLPPDVA
ncbi:MAG: fused MFS/spermidine synthase, partial [Planctomycetota bacterium]|nr:fused MFS/spermidine synthase [Planctomycetota bacterium]